MVGCMVGDAKCAGRYLQRRPRNLHALQSRIGSLVAVALLSLACGCRGTGPRSVPGDRFDYNVAGAQSASEQLLLNIVRLRYGEPAYWLEITSMLSQYELKGGGTLSWFDQTLMPLRNPALRAVYGLDPDPALDKQQEANFSFSDRPTISYAPLQGREFADRLMAPIPPAAVILLAESGWPIDRILDCCVQRINGVPNAPVHDIDHQELRPGALQPDFGASAHAPGSG